MNGPLAVLVGVLAGAAIGGLVWLMIFMITIRNGGAPVREI